MSISMTMIDMINQGNVFQLLIMGVLFILVVIMLVRIGKGIDALYNKPAENTSHPAAAITSDGVTAAIAAAVKQYKKNNQ
ncbi:MAG: sodium pump decarboxylase subunit gamma [Treponema sp.]|nr:sodium pump decarboxylase subunit gamma [Treponema sp.]